MKNWIEIDEKKSFIRLCGLLNASPAEIAKGWLKKKVNTADEIDNWIQDIAGMDYYEFINLVPSYKKTREEFERTKTRFLIKEYSFEELLAFHKVRLSSRKNGITNEIINFDKKYEGVIKWKNNVTDKKEFLNAIPILLSYDDFSWRVGISKKAIKISKAIEYSLEAVLIPIIVNSFFPNLIPQPYANKPDFRNKFKGKYFLENVVKGLTFYFNTVEKCSFLMSHPIIQLVEFKMATKIFGIPLFHSIMDFIFFHEYAHVLLNHFDSKKENKVKEVEADILALNLLFSKNLIKRRKLNEQGMEFNLALHSIAPILLMQMLTALNLANGFKEYDTHPYPLFRAGYLGAIIPDFLEKDQLALENFNNLMNEFTNLFRKIYELQNIPENLDEIIETDF